VDGREARLTSVITDAVITDAVITDAGQNLANTARAVVGTVMEEAGFLERPEGALFMVLHRPAGRPALGLLTVCGSLFAEQHTDYLREVRLARTLAAARFAVVRFHYRGFGNSAAATPSLDALTRDALDVSEAAQRLAQVSRIAFLGVGAGSFAASRALAGHPQAPLLLWKPVTDGAQFFRDFFRARLVAATRLGAAQPGAARPGAARPGAARPASTDELLARLARGEPADVMGFTVPACLYGSLVASRLTDTPPGPRRVLIQPFRGSRTAGAERLATHWSSAGCRVDVQPSRLPEDPWFIPDGAAAAASVRATEDQLIANAGHWLGNVWGAGE
jgi:pimeloyl-ACP methyl ester carboxylesterase